MHLFKQCEANLSKSDYHIFDTKVFHDTDKNI